MKGIKHFVKRIIELVREKEMIPVPALVYNDKLLEKKVALVTGGDSGIGYAIAEAFLKNGCKTIIAGRNEKKLNQAKSQLALLGAIEYIHLDVTQISSLKKTFEDALKLFPGYNIDILVNSAGLMAHGDFLSMQEEEYDAVMAVNLKGSYFMSQVVANYMIKNHIKGHILNVSSAASLRPAWSPYQISKWGISGMTKGLADVLIQYGIVVNAIAPGPTITPMLKEEADHNIFHSHNPSGRFALPEEIASLAAYMVSDMGNLIVGDTFYITGGGGTISCHR